MPPVSMPKHSGDNGPGGAREMVRVQLKENDVRSYSRQDAEKILAATPGAFILGEDAEQAEPTANRAEGKTLDEAAEKFKAQQKAPNKARQGAEAKSE